jgi:threonine dehydrogenase-like Zn-dependent dehydrogenase
MGRGPFQENEFDPHWRLFRPRTRPLYPLPLGNMAVGKIVDAGPGVTRFRPGDDAYGWLPVADVHLCAADKLRSPDGLDDDSALCLDPASFGIGAVDDAELNLAGKIALVSGLGAIGQFVVQVLKLRRATVLAASQFPPRRHLVEAGRADVVFQSGDTPDLGLAVKELTQQRWRQVGVDVAFECSGHYDHLRQAIRATRQGGTVVMIGFYPGPATELRLGEELFHNRLTLKASLPAPRWGNETRSTPPRSHADLVREAADLFRSGRISAAGLLRPILPFAQAAETFRLIAEHPEEVIKVAIRHET